MAATATEIDLADIKEPILCCPNDPDDAKLLGIIVIAGPKGAGKTTSARSTLLQCAENAWVATACHEAKDPDVWA